MLYIEHTLTYSSPTHLLMFSSRFQLKLIDRLKTVHENLTQSRVLYEQSIEDSRRKVKRCSEVDICVIKVLVGYVHAR